MFGLNPATLKILLVAGAVALAGVIGFGVAWSWQGARWDADVQGIRADYAETGRLAEAAAREKEQDLAKRINAVSAQHYAALRAADAKEQALRRDVAAGTVQLRIWVQRATTAESKPAAGGSLDTGEAAILSGQSRQAYNDHRELARRVDKQIIACIDTLINERK